MATSSKLFQALLADTRRHSESHAVDQARALEQAAEIAREDYLEAFIESDGATRAFSVPSAFYSLGRPAAMKAKMTAVATLRRDMEAERFSALMNFWSIEALWATHLGGAPTRARLFPLGLKLPLYLYLLGWTEHAQRSFQRLRDLAEHAPHALPLRRRYEGHLSEYLAVEAASALLGGAFPLQMDGDPERSHIFRSVIKAWETPDAARFEELLNWSADFCLEEAHWREQTTDLPGTFDDWLHPVLFCALIKARKERGLQTPALTHPIFSEGPQGYLGLEAAPIPALDSRVQAAIAIVDRISGGLLSDGGRA